MNSNRRSAFAKIGALILGVPLAIKASDEEIHYDEPWLVYNYPELENVKGMVLSKNYFKDENLEKVQYALNYYSHKQFIDDYGKIHKHSLKLIRTKYLSFEEAKGWAEQNL